MGVIENPFFSNAGRLSNLTPWWGDPGPNGAGALDRQIKRLQQFAADCQRTCADAYRDEMDAILKRNERIGQSVQELLRSRRPPEALAAQSEILAILFEGASLQAKHWAEMTQKLHECCAAIARDAASDLKRQTQDSASAEGKGGLAKRPAIAARRQAAQA